MKHKIITILILIALIGAVQAEGYIKNPGTPRIKEALWVEKIPIQANATGYFSDQVDSIMIGTIEAITYVNRNCTEEFNITLAHDLPNGLIIDYWNVSAGNSTRLPRYLIPGSTDAWGAIPIFSKPWINVSGGKACGSAEVYIAYK
jgi:hypothetical protein